MSDILKRIQNTEYNILKELDRICKKYDIEYFLGQGTLLGAAKYKGFIPWDDDIDVLIRYDELERLTEIFRRETDKNYIITNYHIERHNALSWTKIRDKNTLSRPKRYAKLPINWGVCIDLFPIYPISDLRPLRMAEIFIYKAANKLLMSGMTRYDENCDLLTRAAARLPLNFRRFCMDIAFGILKLHGNDSEYVLLPCRGTKVVRRDIIFGEKKYLYFEGEKYAVPTDYHTYLTINFGDYMGDPPENEARGHDDRLGEIEWKL